MVPQRKAIVEKIAASESSLLALISFVQTGEFRCYIHETLDPAVRDYVRVCHKYPGILVHLAPRVCEVIRTWGLVELLIQYVLRNMMLVLAVHAYIMMQAMNSEEIGVDNPTPSGS